MKFVSVDVETGGRDPATSDLLEVGVVLGDTATLSNKAALRVLVLPEKGKYKGIDTFCAEMHSKSGLLEEIHEASVAYKDRNRFSHRDYSVWEVDSDPTLPLLDREAEIKLQAVSTPEGLPWLLTRILQENKDWLISSKINLAGKNPHFDRSFLESQPLWAVRSGFSFRHSMIDPSILFTLREDEHVPDLEECLRRIGRKPRELHTALGNALDVCDLIYHSCAQEQGNIAAKSNR